MPYLNRVVPHPEPLDCRILTAALKLFRDKGYHNTSVHEIQQKARVSIGSIYNYFGGKEGIAKALYTHILGEIEQLVDAHMARQPSAIARCEGIISALFAHTETHPDIIGYVFHAKHADFLPDHASLSDAAAFTKMKQIVCAGIAQGELQKMDPVIANALIFGSAAQLIQQRLDGVIKEPLQSRERDFFACLWHGLKNSTPAPP